MTSSIKTIVVYEYVYKYEVEWGHGCGSNIGAHIFFQQTNPPNPKHDYTPRYTAYLRDGRFEAIWRYIPKYQSNDTRSLIPSFLQNTTDPKTIAAVLCVRYFTRYELYLLTISCNALCNASGDEISISDFERICTNEAMAEDIESTEMNFVDTIDDNSFPFMELYMNASPHGHEEVSMNIWLKRQKGIVLVGDEEASLSKAEKDRLRVRPEFDLPESGEEDRANSD
ncbi:hypothetical protein BDZ45DRAFT_736639 [Acephala macrosclerotiorum]|nr:hypothetical protein BDZ45DRAFT_736639 [Acephala macrosclerotiorum]